MQYKDYYEILGVSRDASQDEIHRAYRTLARSCHPDINKEPGAEQRFKEVAEAHEVLKDPEKRAAYDRLGSGWQAGQDFRTPSGWDTGSPFAGGGHGEADGARFSDFFEALFGRGFGDAWCRSAGPSRGEDVHARVEIDLEDAFHGGVRELSLRRPEPRADGSRQLGERTLQVRIPRGVHPGQHIRLAGQGSPGVSGAAPGDLYLEVEIRPHRLFRVEGRDVVADFPIAPWEAALGATVRAPTPSGSSVQLKIPEGSAAGTRLRVRGHGLPSQPPGDLYLVLRIALPPADSAQARSLYRDMQDKLDFNPRSHLGL